MRSLFSFSGGTLAGGGGGGAPSSVASIHFPRDNGRRAVRIRRDRQDAAVPQDAPPRLVGDRNAPELAAVDERNLVMLGEALVDERVVGRQQIEHAAVLAHDALEQQLGFARERLPQVVVELGNRSLSGTAFLRFRSCSHWPAKLLTSASDLGSASMRRTCCASTARSCSRPRAARSSSWSSGMLLQRKNDRREARS